MFWVIDNFLMRKNVRMVHTNSKEKGLEPVLFKGGNQRHYPRDDDEVSLQLLSNEIVDSDDVSDSEIEYRYKNGSTTLIKSRR